MQNRNRLTENKASGYQRREGREERQIMGMGLRDTNYYKIDKQQGFIV